MAKIRLTRLFSFEMAHALNGYDGACRNIHGHSYKLQVTVIGTPLEATEHPKNGMVMDFGNLKKLVYHAILDELDHALLLPDTSNPELVETLQKLHHKLVLTPYQPTCENMLLDFKTRLQNQMPLHVELHSIKLWETQNSFAEWYAADQV
ncbi:6-pyruvoyl trahydropterin synthase family protein [Pontibacter arcticus]|uniref:6-carboxy-5,6,7,8-tetrahydropterin synthase n=1 Tax=Pontibacter arcticus TaxID=2080288 RepID=A0A364REQ3_9BACT|nr:6-carboxytetrahydropterin synthase [Pontibacter arcticus]RAU82820.1 6-carboxytetrahydropterin synthase QueD [Pontibacter arcticus]